VIIRHVFSSLILHERPNLVQLLYEINPHLRETHVVEQWN